MISAEIICDSLNPAGVRLTTFVLNYPKFIHGEVMTHRAFSRNASSSRAIPTDKMLSWVQETPAMPIKYRKNQKGMQGGDELSNDLAGACEVYIKGLRNRAVDCVAQLNKLGLHKQSANRYLEPWLHMTTLVSATDFANQFALRVHEMAQDEYQELAYLMLKAYVGNRPRQLKVGEWHLPFSDHAPFDVTSHIEQALKLCTGRCARVSYKNQDGQYNPEDDYAIHDRLIAQHPGHWSPLEHCAMARGEEDSGYKAGPHDGFMAEASFTSSNFRGFTQYRKRFSDRENVMEMDYAKHLADYEQRTGRQP